jgi:hypothetical protein
VTAERLELLAAACHGVIHCRTAGFVTGLSNADLADLARCAAAWATLERELLAHKETSICILFGHTQVLCMSYGGKSYGPTAIEAVEAAGEGRSG